jgi:hypothetical protein
MRALATLSFVTCVEVLGACAQSKAGSPLPYMPNTTSVLGGNFDNGAGLTPMSYATPDGDACIDLDGACVKPQTECGDNGSALVLLDSSQAVADVVCYPASGTPIDQVEGDLKQVANDATLVLDNRPDGPDVTGNATVDGNNASVFGHGPDVSVIAGDLHIKGNNALVSGVRVQGDVVIEKNNPSLVDCVIEGDLTIHGNNVNIALCEVWGTLKIDGNNTVLVANKFQNLPELLGNNLRCSSNLGFVDQNSDHAIADSELTGPIECAEPKPVKTP